jgi:hypothetical protein
MIRANPMRMDYAEKLQETMTVTTRELRPSRASSKSFRNWLDPWMTNRFAT